MQIIIRSEWIASSAYEQFHLIDNWQWQWGYKLNTVQPPLYTWLFKLIVQVCNFLGLDFKFADSLFRQFLIIANLLISYLILRHYKIDRLNSIFSSAGLFLLSDFSWDNQDYFTHTSIAVTMLLWFMLQFVLLLNQPTLQNYSLLGITIACCLLSKYNTLFSIVGVSFAALSIPSIRDIILQPRFLIVPLIVSVVTLPHFHWLFSTSNPLTEIEKIFNSGSVTGPLMSLLIGIGGLSYVFIMQTLPLLISLTLTFQFRLRWLTALTLGNNQQVLFGRAFLITILIHMVFMIISGASRIVMRWTLPTVLLLSMALPLAALRTGKINRYGKGIFISAIIGTALAFSVMTSRDFLKDSWILPYTRGQLEDSVKVP